MKYIINKSMNETRALISHVEFKDNKLAGFHSLCFCIINQRVKPECPELTHTPSHTHILLNLVKIHRIQHCQWSYSLDTTKACGYTTSKNNPSTYFST